MVSKPLYIKGFLFFLILSSFIYLQSYVVTYLHLHVVGELQYGLLFSFLRNKCVHVHYYVSVENK